MRRAFKVKMVPKSYSSHGFASNPQLLWQLLRDYLFRTKIPSPKKTSCLKILDVPLSLFMITELLKILIIITVTSVDLFIAILAFLFSQIANGLINTFKMSLKKNIIWITQTSCDFINFSKHLCKKCFNFHAKRLHFKKSTLYILTFLFTLRCVLFSTHIKPVEHVLTPTCSIASIEWRGFT